MVWTFNKRSKLIRFYVWLYKASPKQVTFCKLFWGVVLAPIVLIARGIAKVFTPLAKHVDGDKLLDTADNAFNRVESFVERHRWMRGLKIPVRVRWWAYAALWTVIGLSGLFSCIKNPWELFFWLPLAALNLTIQLAKRHTAFGGFMAAGYHALKDRTCPRIEVTDRAA